MAIEPVAAKLVDGERAEVVILLDDQLVRRLQGQVFAVRLQDGLDGGRVGPATTCQLVGDPGRLRALLQLADVLLAATALHRDHSDEAATGDEADEQQPPLKLRHVAGRIGRVAERTLPR